MFIEGIMGSPEGTSGPQPCLQGVVGYTTKAPKENQRFSGAAAVVSRPPERERHNLTSDARLLCELWQSEQNRSTSSQGLVVFKQCPDSSVPQSGDCAENKDGRKLNAASRHSAFLHPSFMKGDYDAKLRDYENRETEACLRWKNRQAQ